MKSRTKKYDDYKPPVRVHVLYGHRDMEKELFYQLFESSYDDCFRRLEKYYDESKGTELGFLKTITRKDFIRRHKEYKKHQHERDKGFELRDEGVDIISKLDETPDFKINLNQFFRTEFAKLAIPELGQNEDTVKKVFNENLPILKRKYWVADVKISQKELDRLMGEEKKSVTNLDFYLTENLFEIQKIKAWMKKQ